MSDSRRGEGGGERRRRHRSDHREEDAGSGSGSRSSRHRREGQDTEEAERRERRERRDKPKAPSSSHRDKGRDEGRDKGAGSTSSSRRHREDKESSRHRSDRDRDRDKGRERDRDRDRDGAKEERRKRHRDGEAGKAHTSSSSSRRRHREDDSSSRSRDRKDRGGDRSDRKSRSERYGGEREGERSRDRRRDDPGASPSTSRNKTDGHRSSSDRSSRRDRDRERGKDGSSSRRHKEGRSSSRGSHLAPDDARSSQRSRGSDSGSRPTSSSSRRLPKAPVAASGGRPRGRDKPTEDQPDLLARKREKEMLALLKEAEQERQRDQAQAQAKAKAKAEADPASEAGADYDYEDDFEDDYGDDFEDGSSDEEGTDAGAGSDSDPPAVTVVPPADLDEVLGAIAQENRLSSAGSPGSGSLPHTPSIKDRLHSPATRPARPSSGAAIAAAPAHMDFGKATKQRSPPKKTRRQLDLEKLIELDVVSFSLFEAQPLTEYELYIRNFGQSGTRQAGCQLNEDNLSRDVQTDPIASREKWTQEPPNDLVGCGGNAEEIDDDEAATSLETLRTDTARLNEFLQRAGRVCAVLVEENAAGSRSRTSGQGSRLQISTECHRLGNSFGLVAGRPVVAMAFCSSQPNLLLTAYGPLATASATGSSSVTAAKSVLCVWSLDEPSVPQHTLVCESTAGSCCLSAKGHIVFAGLNDGAVVLWDLRESVTMHKPVTLDGQEYLLRSPTYSTEGIVSAGNHTAQIVDLQTVEDAPSAASSAASALRTSAFQVGTLDQDAILKVWTVAELPKGDPSGSEYDLGLIPGGRVKLIPNASIQLGLGRRDSFGDTEALCLQFHPANPNLVVVGTNKGRLINGVRFGDRVVPRSFSAPYGALRTCTCLAFAPFSSKHFLAGFSGGVVALYVAHREQPLLTWEGHCQDGVAALEWSPTRPAVFFAVDLHSRIVVWDLLKNDRAPVVAEQAAMPANGGAASDAKVPLTAFRISAHRDGQRSGGSPSAALAYRGGAVELHTLSPAVCRPRPDEAAQFTAFLAALM